MGFLSKTNQGKNEGLIYISFLVLASINFKLFNIIFKFNQENKQTNNYICIKLKLDHFINVTKEIGREARSIVKKKYHYFKNWLIFIIFH